MSVAIVVSATVGNGDWPGEGWPQNSHRPWSDRGRKVRLVLSRITLALASVALPNAFCQTALTTAQIAKKVSPSVVVIEGKTDSGGVSTTPVSAEPTRPPACSRRAGGLSPVIRPPENGAICWLRFTKNPPSGDVLSC